MNKITFRKIKSKFHENENSGRYDYYLILNGRKTDYLVMAFYSSAESTIFRIIYPPRTIKIKVSRLWYDNLEAAKGALVQVYNEHHA